jgi:hypothetical protein
MTQSQCPATVAYRFRGTYRERIRKSKAHYREQNRPGLRERQRQYCRNPRRCQAITVAGLTNTSGERHSEQTLDRAIQKTRSSGFSRGRLWMRASACELLAEGQVLQGESTARCEDGVKQPDQ